jgi:hypothetical protein
MTASPRASSFCPRPCRFLPEKLVASFEFTVTDDSLINLDRTVAVTPAAPNVTGSPTSVVVGDNETRPVAALSLPDTVTEGAIAANATISLDIAPDVAVTFALASNPSGEVTVPSTVTIAAGQKQAIFTVQAVIRHAAGREPQRDDNGDRAANRGRQAGKSLRSTTSFPHSSLTLPASLTEGETQSGTLLMSGALSGDVEITLASSNSAALTVPGPSYNFGRTNRDDLLVDRAE